MNLKKNKNPSVMLDKDFRIKKEKKEKKHIIVIYKVGYNFRISVPFFSFSFLTLRTAAIFLCNGLPLHLYEFRLPTIHRWLACHSKTTTKHKQ